jgi:glutathione S-transferase
MACLYVLSSGYSDETKRLYGVLEIRLKDRDWLAGDGRGKFSLADIKAVPWVKLHKFSLGEELDEWPNVKAWVERTVARSGAGNGFGLGKKLGYNW